MNKYLQELLKLANTVILPGLGALTITNDKTGDIFFISYLKHDDGKLAEFIASKEGIELIDAKNNLAKYVREITALLDKGESFDIFNFGKFIKDASGEIVFEQSTKIGHKLSESTYSIDSNEKLAEQLEKFQETENENQQTDIQPSLDSILNEKSTQIEYKQTAEEENTTETINKNTNADLEKEKTLEIEVTEQQKDPNEDKKESSSTSTSSLEEEKNSADKTSTTLEEKSDKKNENSNTEKEKISNKKNNSETTSNTTDINSLNISETNSKTGIDEQKNNIANSELKTPEKQQNQKDNQDLTSPTSNKSSNKKTLLGILIPLLITALVFTYFKFYKTSLKENKYSKLSINKESQVKPKDSIPQTKDTAINNIKTYDTIQNTSANSSAPTNVTPVNPNQITQTNNQPVYQQPTPSTLPKTTTTQIQVIVGTFTQKANASIFIQQLNQRGYSTGKIIENGGLILVSLGSFPTIQEAANFGRTLKLPTGYWLKATK